MTMVSFFRCRDASSTTSNEPKVDNEINSESAVRVRTFAHERGNWATFIYVKSEFCLGFWRIVVENFYLISSSIQRQHTRTSKSNSQEFWLWFKHSIPFSWVTAHKSDQNRCPSAPLDWWVHEIRQGKYRRFQEVIQSTRKRAQLNLTNFFRFNLNLDKLNVYLNDECTTTFVAIAVPDIYCTPLKTLVEKFNSCLGEYKLPCFYKVKDCVNRGGNDNSK